MTTVVETLQAGETTLGDPDRSGGAAAAEARAHWRLFGQDQTAVLLIEGPDDLQGWPSELISGLIGCGLTVVTYDIEEGEASDPVSGADLALAVLDAAGVGAVHLVGASAGGLVAQAIAAVASDRVASMTLLMTRLPRRDERRVADEIAARLAPVANTGAGAGTASGAPARTDAITRHNAAIAVVAAPRAGQRARARRRASVAFERGTDPVAALERFARGGDQRTFTSPPGIPTVLIHGRDDPIVTLDDATALADALGGTLVLVPTAHDLPWGAEELVSKQVAAVAAAAVVGDEPPRRAARPKWVRRAGWAGGIVAFLLVAALIAASSITVPYYAIRPGLARRTNDLVRVPADKHFEPKGEVLFVTVGVQRLHALEWLLAKNDDDVDVVPESAILGTANPKQYQQQSTQAMVDSKETAAVIALERLCLPVRETGTGARVEKVVAGSPAEKAGLQAEDTITAIGSTPVSTVEEALRPLRALKPGSPFTLTAVGPTTTDQPRKMSGVLGANPQDASRSFLGVSLRTRAENFVLPFDVAVETARVGGPSAGLAFTLALLDQLTPGELTGGGKVAATGTIELDGSVGPVGGVPQKAIAVKRSGARLFLVPSSELKEAKARVGSSVEVVPVDTLEQALAALKAHGGDLSGIPDHCP